MVLRWFVKLAHELSVWNFVSKNKYFICSAKCEDTIQPSSVALTKSLIGAADI